MRYCIVASLFLTALVHAQEPKDLVFERLAKVENFAFGGTGYAGVRSQGEKDYRIILSRPTAAADFERLYLRGNPQARTYALVALRRLNPKRFEELLPSVRTSKEDITTQNGCIVSDERLGTIIKQIQRGQYEIEQ